LRSKSINTALWSVPFIEKSEVKNMGEEEDWEEEEEEEED